MTPVLLDHIEALEEELVALRSASTENDLKRLREIVQLNASNQQLAQTIKDMDAGYERNVQRFEKIQRRAQRILDFERLNVITDHRLTWIVSLAKDGIAEEGDNP